MSRARKVSKNELVKVAKEINRRMSDFEDSVQKLQDLKDTLVELNDGLEEQEQLNKDKMDQLNKDFEDNKIKAVAVAVESLGKVVISQEELAELKTNLEKAKSVGKEHAEQRISNIQKKCDEKIEQSLKLQQLQHECDTAQLRAEVEAQTKAIANLNSTLDRMTDELNSQKKLTADVAGMSRPSTDK